MSDFKNLKKYVRAPKTIEDLVGAPSEVVADGEADDRKDDAPPNARSTPTDLRQTKRED